MSNEVLGKMVDALDRDKRKFLKNVRESVHSYVSSRTTLQCLTLVERRLDGKSVKKWPPEATVPYAYRLQAFLRQSRVEITAKNFFRRLTGQRKTGGRIIDSALTTPIIGKVEEEFKKLYQSHDAVAKATLCMMLLNKELSMAFADGLVNTQAFQKASRVGRSKLAGLAIGCLKEELGLPEHMSDIIVPKVAALIAGGLSQPVIAKTAVAVGHGISLASSHTVTQVAAGKLVHLLQLKIGAFIGKVMAIPALKSTIGMLVKKFVVVAIIAGVLKMLAVTTAVTVGKLVTIILALFLGHMLYKTWKNFPKNLADEISKKLTTDLGKEFRGLNWKFGEALALKIPTQETKHLASGAGATFADLFVAEVLPDLAKAHQEVIENDADLRKFASELGYLFD